VTYADAIQFLYSLQLFGSQFGLERAHQLAEFAGNPQNSLRFIHVAGTNGKGSTCAMLESIYRTAGLRVGLYTSPHLVSFRERIQIDREPISEVDVTRLVVRIKGWLEDWPRDNHPTFFEIITVIALQYFAERKCDLVIWETGLGGRLDATNIVMPLASVITNIQFDHEKWLGNTLEQIAGEKAGIIKARVPVITGPQEPPALRVIRDQAKQQAAPLHLAEEPAPADAIGLEGEHQRRNAALAVKTVEVLSDAIPVSKENVAKGLSSVHWPGRFQIVRRGLQTIILDGAHNPNGAKALVSTLRARNLGPLTLIVGMLEDKNVGEICEILGSIALQVIAVPVANSRTAAPENIAVALRSANPKATVTTAASLGEALARTGSEKIVVVSGSLYLIGEALELLGEAPRSGERALNEWSARPR
jgi:dihydrofolate synthase/folylpolyglutamate synthase